MSGFPWSNETREPEIINMENEDLFCSQNFGNYPQAISYPVGGLVENKIIICGGHFFDTSSHSSDECHILNPSGSDFLAKMHHRRAGASSALYNTTLWITGS